MAGTKVAAPSASGPGGDLGGDLDKIRQESRADIIANARFNMEMARMQNWGDAVKQHAEQVKTGARG
jgi:hypothetical protein